AVVAFVLGTPVHVTPGNGSIRCKNSIISDGFRYTDRSEGLSAECTSAGKLRLAEGSVAVLVLLASGAVGTASRRVRRPVRAVAAVAILAICLAVAANLMG